MEKNKEIYNLCEDIRSFCFANATREVIKEKNQSEGAFNAAKKTSMLSEIGVLIKNNDWKKLFANERWLLMLEEVALINSLKKYEPVSNALIKLLELFPKETEGRINPLFLHYIKMKER